MLRALDYGLLKMATEWTAAADWHAVLIRFCAEYLVFVVAVVLFVFWQNPMWRHRYGAQKAVVMSIFSLVLALALKMLIAFVWARSRPYVSHPELFHLPLRVDMISFPSGHTLVASSIAFSLYLSGWKKTGVWLLIIATLIGLARVFSGVHYPSDILGGLFIAWISAWFIHRESSTIKRYLPEH